MGERQLGSEPVGWVGGQWVRQVWAESKIEGRCLDVVCTKPKHAHIPAW